MSRKELHVFAGPNGSGKSTIKALTDDYGNGLLYVNADDLKRSENITDMEAALLAERIREQYLTEGKSFMFETVLSTDRNLELMRRAKAAGYWIRMIYVLTQDPAINVSRVQFRVTAGGHDVPAEKIVERYGRCILLLPAALQVSDSAIVYNNSFANPLVIVEKESDTFIIHPKPFPSLWTADRLVALIEPQTFNRVLRADDTRMNLF